MIFVTGGTGLLGAHVLVELSKRGKSIKALKRKSSNLKTVKQVFDFYLKDQSDILFSKIDWVDGDLNDTEILIDLVTNCTEIYHCAGVVSFRKRDFRLLMKINKQGTANLVNIALKLGVQKFCHVSSTAAIGRDEKGSQYSEKSKWINSKSNSNYAVSKYSAELEVWRAKEEGLNVVIVNPSVILGAGNWNDSSLTLFKSVNKGLKFYTNGINAFVDARDVASCMIELMEKNIFGERFLTISENIEFQKLFNLIADELKVKRPSIKVKKWMTAIAWRLESLKSFITGNQPQITKETTASAMSISKYSNSKITAELEFEFAPIKESVKNAVAFHHFVSEK
jgi:nucleoside-diphosphate-sugar epimerase